MTTKKENSKYSEIMVSVLEEKIFSGSKLDKEQVKEINEICKKENGWVNAIHAIAKDFIGLRDYIFAVDIIEPEFEKRVSQIKWDRSPLNEKYG